MPTRETLGDFSSIVCFKAVVVGVEETLGAQAAAVALRGAGRKRGKALAAELGFGKDIIDIHKVGPLMNAALGPEGTKLCKVDAVRQEGDNIIVDLTETVCSAGEPQGSKRELTFTMGAIQGAIEVLTQKKLKAKQVGSVLRGDTHDRISLEPM